MRKGLLIQVFDAHGKDLPPCVCSQCGTPSIYPKCNDCCKKEMDVEQRLHEEALEKKFQPGSRVWISLPISSTRVQGYVERVLQGARIVRRAAFDGWLYGDAFEVPLDRLEPLRKA